jgi:hypothetical protein
VRGVVRGVVKGVEMGIAVGVDPRVEASSGASVGVGVGSDQRMCRGIDLVQPIRPLTIPARHLLAMPQMRRVGCSGRFAGLREGDPVDSTPRFTDRCPAVPPLTSPNHALSMLTPGERS